MLSKKGGQLTALDYAAALDEALCFGWIDGQAAPRDDSTRRRLTPRRSTSSWSRRNVENVARLTTAGKITPVGQAAVEAAKADGRWEADYPGPAAAEIPGDSAAALANDAAARDLRQATHRVARDAGPRPDNPSPESKAGLARWLVLNVIGGAEVFHGSRDTAGRAPAARCRVGFAAGICVPRWWRALPCQGFTGF